MVDVVVNHGLAADIFDVAPDFHSDILVIRNYTGQVELQWEWDGTSFNEPDYNAAAEEGVRLQRDMLLSSEVDPIVCNPLRWADLTTAQQNAWTQYRTDLLNITDQSGFPDNVTWPTKP